MIQSTTSSREGALRVFLRDWDRADQALRTRMLDSFIQQNQGRAELHGACAPGASLFLARLTTWIRLTYPSGAWPGSEGRGPLQGAPRGGLRGVAGV